MSAETPCLKLGQVPHEFQARSGSTKEMRKSNILLFLPQNHFQGPGTVQPTTLTPAFLQTRLQDLRRRVAAVILPSLEVQNSWVTAGSSSSSTAEIKQEGWIFVPL